jgi:hypothetical protein
MATTPKSYGTILDFKSIQVNHQRNGIAGVSFTSVQFSYQEKGGRFHPAMLAIVPDDANLKGGDINCYVVDMSDTSECWRGDNFVEPVMDAIKAFRKSEDERWGKLVKRAG